MSEPRVRAVLTFVALTCACAALIAATAALTGERIEENRARRFQQTLTALAGSARAAADVRWSADDVAPLCHGGSGRALLRGSADGYGGPIRWLAAADVDGPAPTLRAVRISAHQETPGIADFLDRPGTDWLATLNGADAVALADVDTVSGATITTRGLRRSLTAALQRPALVDAECPA